VWSRVLIPIDSLALTYQGQLVERKLDFQADKVISVGVSVSAAAPEDAIDGSSSSSTGKIQGDASAGDISSESLGVSEDGSSTAAQVEMSPQKPHELFRLLLRDIRAEGEM
jgi:hypothetical protein